MTKTQCLKVGDIINLDGINCRNKISGELVHNWTGKYVVTSVKSDQGLIDGYWAETVPKIKAASLDDQSTVVTFFNGSLLCEPTSNAHEIIPVGKAKAVWVEIK